MFPANFNSWECPEMPTPNIVPVDPQWMLSNNTNPFGNNLCSNSFSTSGQNLATSYQPMYIPYIPSLGMAYVWVYRYVPQVYVGSGAYAQTYALPPLNSQVENFMVNSEVTNNMQNYAQESAQKLQSLRMQEKVRLYA